MYIQGLITEAMQHRAIQHPYLDSMAEGTFPDPAAAIADLTFQYLPYSNDFLRYLTATLSQIESREYCEWLMHNLMEEAGHIDEEDAQELEDAGMPVEWVQGGSHPMLYRRFLDALGMDEAWRS